MGIGRGQIWLTPEQYEAGMRIPTTRPTNGGVPGPGEVAASDQGKGTFPMLVFLGLVALYFLLKK